MTGNFVSGEATDFKGNVRVVVWPGHGGRGSVAAPAVTGQELSYRVRVWEIRTYERRDGRSFQVRWTVDGRVHHEAFRYLGLARSFQARLISAASLGEAFDTASGLPVSMVPAEPDTTTWHEFALAYVLVKWP